MTQEVLIEQLFDALIAGDRDLSRAIVTRALDEFASPEEVVSDLFWPVYERIEKLYRADKMTRLAHHLSTRLLRVLTDQTAAQIKRGSPRDRVVFAVCGPTDPDELAAQMAVDLLEASGYEVAFAGGSIANDEILGEVQSRQPDVLLMFASAPTDLPNIRELIDTIREIGALKGLQIVVGGGVFGRADELAEEIGADLWAHSPADLVDAITSEPTRRATPDQRTVGRNKRTTRSAAA